MNNLELLDLSFMELLIKADAIRRKFIKDNVEICSILNAKSGKCTEDCKYCAQSGYHKSESLIYPLKREEEIVNEAIIAENNGAQRFGIVTSGNSLTDTEIDVICNATDMIIKKHKIKVCGSLGDLTIEQMKKLKSAGMDRYHHNIETSRSFYPQIVTTHTFDDRVKTIKRAQSLGFSICSGGILGLGESWEDRLEMANILKELNVESVPINILIPVKGTKLENNPPISYMDIVKTVAIFRIILEDKTVRFCGGRELKLKDFQGLGFLAGANGLMIGGYLTVGGRTIEEDQNLIEEIKNLWNS